MCSLTPFNPAFDQSPFMICDGTLSVTGTNSDDLIQAFDIGNGMIRTKLSAGGTTWRADVNRSQFDSLKLVGFGGDDTIKNFANTVSTILGGSGADTLVGGQYDDRIYGNNGNDWISARYGNDYVNGGAGDDRIYGGNGNDKLRGWSGSDEINGGSGNDVLIGNSGDDRLIGGSGDDFVHGGSGNDAIIGTAGIDRLYGGSGADRLLRTYAGSLEDYRSWDAVVDFRSGAQTTTVINGNQVTFASGQFSIDEIVSIDDAFRTIVRRTGENTLLRRADGGALKFYRHGRVLSGPSNIGGWNSSGREIHFNNNSFSSYNWLQQVTYHEIGHNWDDSSENSSISQFRSLSGWNAVNNQWQSESGATNFVRAYSRNSALDDFATSMSAYFMAHAGLSFAGTAVNSPGVGYSAAPDKMAYMSAFVDWV